jgi:hippurate hydrolase
MLNTIKNLARTYTNEFIEVRHHLHANPELSYEEFNTSKFIQSKLSEWTIPFEVKATTGVVGLIKGKNPDKRIVALRADMARTIVPVRHLPAHLTRAALTTEFHGVPCEVCASTGASVGHTASSISACASALG